MVTSPEECAWELLEVAPMIMRAIRNRVRSHRTSELSVPQFRALAFLGRSRGASLSDVAEYMGITRPSASKLIEGLVTRGLVRRKGSSVDRRRITLVLTSQGRVTLRLVRAAAQGDLAERMGELTSNDRTTIAAAMRTLRSVFASDAAGQAVPETESGPVEHPLLFGTVGPRSV